jgi:hypothetical protein
MPAVQFWLMHAGLVGAAGVILIVVRLLFGHILLAGDDITQADVVAADAVKAP